MHEELYLHIGNSGATIGVRDNGAGPELYVESSAFGNIVNEVKVKTTAVALAKLSILLAKAAIHEGYSEAYCHAAKPDGTLEEDLLEIRDYETSMDGRAEENPPNKAVVQHRFLNGLRKQLFSWLVENKLAKNQHPRVRNEVAQSAPKQPMTINKEEFLRP